MADDAHNRLRERMANVEKRAMAWIRERRPELRDKTIVEIIMILRKEEHQARSQADSHLRDEFSN
jgi:hypothetical protein